MVDVRGDVLRPPHGTTPAAVKGSKSVHASDESCHIMYVTETKITFCDSFSYFIHLWLHLENNPWNSGWDNNACQFVQ